MAPRSTNLTKQQLKDRQDIAKVLCAHVFYEANELYLQLIKFGNLKSY